MHQRAGRTGGGRASSLERRPPSATGGGHIQDGCLHLLTSHVPFCRCRGRHQQERGEGAVHASSLHVGAGCVEEAPFHRMGDRVLGKPDAAALNWSPKSPFSPLALMPCPPPTDVLEARQPEAAPCQDHLQPLLAFSVGIAQEAAARCVWNGHILQERAVDGGAGLKATRQVC